MNPQNLSHVEQIELLSQTHQWPGVYTFKFVISTDHSPRLLHLMGDHNLVRSRPSRTGKYTSFTIEKEFETPEGVLDQYAKVRQIKGIISL